jgi:hypothetical protein
MRKRVLGRRPSPGRLVDDVPVARGATSSNDWIGDTTDRAMRYLLR